jgi:hypothetical protein
MNTIFHRSKSVWVRYDSYEIKPDEHGKLFLTPTKDAKPHVYNPMKCGETLVVDALNIGKLMLEGRKMHSPEVRSAILEFASKYGLLGFITSLPTTPDFMHYEYVYLFKNPFIRDERLDTHDFTNRFFPFEELAYHKEKGEAIWVVQGGKDMLELAMAFNNAPMAVNMSVMRNYSEPYEWYARQLRGFAFTFFNVFFYYRDNDSAREEESEMLRKSMKTFGSTVPTYHIELQDKPMLYWDFSSLVSAIGMMLSLMITDEENPIHMCKHCTKLFVSTRSNAAFCSPTCKNRYNVYKSRERKELEEE